MVDISPDFRCSRLAFLLPALSALWGLAASDQPPLMNHPCWEADKPYAQMPFCDASLSVDARVADIISRLTLQDKINLMRQDGPPIPQLGLTGYNWWEEATHGIAPPRNGNRTQTETNFAFPITTGMSFNRTLWRKTAQQIAREARVFANAGDEYSTFWTPVVNLAREPRWGRNIETPGEDPYHSSEYAVHFIQGFQEAPEDSEHLLASACCKHYVANEMEASEEAGFSSDRNHFDANISMQDLVDSYMVPFQACVERGKVTSLMCSYNSVNGVPSCANDWLLGTVAREAWGFDGAIVSDCDADSDVFNSHHYTASPEESVREILRAGTDVDCGDFITKHAASAIDRGIITEADLEERLRFQFRLRMRLGHFDPPGPLDALQLSEVCSDYALALMRDGAMQGATLLRNDAGTLPLDASKLGSVAVLGPNGNLSESIASYYGGNRPCGMKFWTLADAVREHVGDVKQVLGVKTVGSMDDPDPAALQAAQDAEIVILGLGTDLDLAREGFDARGIEVPLGQMKLFHAVAEVAKNPIVVVLLTATPLDISELLSHPKVGAVLHVGQPSVAVVGLGDVLFGQKPPAGRMVQTFYPKAYADEISIFDFNMRPGTSAWPRPDCQPEDGDFRRCPRGTNPGRTHRFYVGKAVVPFGYGLSYTTFKYELMNYPTGSVSLASVQALLKGAEALPFLSHSKTVKAQLPVSYEVRVTNTGAVDSDHVVLGFLKPPNAGVAGAPLQVLFGFERVHIPAGEAVTVWLYPSPEHFTQVDRAGHRKLLVGSYTVHFGLRETAAFGMGYSEHLLRTVEGEEGLDSVEFV